MQLTLIQKIDLTYNGYIVASTVLSDNSMAAIFYDSALQPSYRLVVQTVDTDGTGGARVNTNYLDLDFIGPDDFKYSLTPLTLFAWDGKPCVLMNGQTAYWLIDNAQSPKKIDIQGCKKYLEGLYVNRHGFHSSTQTDCDVIGISLKHRGSSMNDKPRWFGLLKMDSHARSLRWVYSGQIQEYSPSLTNLSLSTIGLGQDTLKFDSMAVRNNTLYAFCPGVSSSNVDRWGMDFYCVKQASIIRGPKKYTVDGVRTIFESQEKSPLSAKITGAYGVFSASGDVLILRPLSKNDEWKGKPKAYDFATSSLRDIVLPRGVSKGHILQATDRFVWYEKSENISYDADNYHSTSQTTLFCLRREQPLVLG